MPRMPRRPTALRRAALRLLLGLLLALPAAACSNAGDPEPSGTFPPLAVPSLPSVADGVSQDGVPQLVNVLVAGGEVTGVDAVVEVRLNTRVRLTVLADTADVLLVRGYDVRTQLGVDQPVQVEILASRQGEVEVLLEQSGLVLTTLRIS